MISDRSLCKLIELVKILEEEHIKGEFVECGVWKGGACMILALAQIKFSKIDRDIWLYDTYEGMTRPQEKYDGPKSINKFNDIRAGIHKDRYDKWHGEKKWIYSPIELVKKNMYLTGYEKEKIKFIKGDVLETLDTYRPSKIALLRLDTDWYASTKKELEILAPNIEIGGYLVIDDYYAWQGSRKATDEFMLLNNNKYVIIDNKFPCPIIFKKIA